MAYAGIDIANRTSAICLLDGEGNIEREMTVGTDEGSLASALSATSRRRVVLEASPLAEWVAAVIEGIGHEAVIIDARAAKNLVSAAKKTDERDARTLAQMSRTGWYTAVHRKSGQARQQRSRIQARQALVRTHTRLNSQLRGLLRAHGVRVGPVSAGQFGDRVRQLLAEQLPELAFALEPLIVVYEQALAKARELEGELSRMARRDQLNQRLQSIPGVGPLVSTAYIATIDDPRRFNSQDELADYIGLAPRVYQSGDCHYHGRISREGDKLLRWHLVEAAHALLCRGADCALKRWGQRLAERKGQAKAKVAVARKLAGLLRRLWLTGERFQAWPETA